MNPDTQILVMTIIKHDVYWSFFINCLMSFLLIQKIRQHESANQFHWLTLIFWLQWQLAGAVKGFWMDHEIFLGVGWGANVVMTFTMIVLKIYYDKLKPRFKKVTVS